RYGSGPDIIGATMRVNGVPATVIGVMSPGFGFPERAELWQPLALRPVDDSTARGVADINAFGRLKASATLGQAEVDPNRVMPRVARALPDADAKLTAKVRPFRDQMTGGPLRVIFTALMGASIVLLLTACANVGCLLLARSASRTAAVAVQM